MDRRVKERLVGASILVAIIVLIVPELLSGPATPRVSPKLPAGAPAPVRNVTVDLTTAKAPPIEPAMDPAARGTDAASAAGRAPGADAAPGTAASVPSPQPSPPVAAPRASPPVPLESAAPAPTTPMSAALSTPAAAGHGWAVQLGSFASHANADKLAHQVKEQGFAVYVLSGGSGAAQRYRVRIGPLADRGAATQAEAKLKAMGHIGTVVPPGA